MMEKANLANYKNIYPMYCESITKQYPRKSANQDRHREWHLHTTCANGYQSMHIEPVPYDTADVLKHHQYISILWVCSYIWNLI